MSDGIVDSGPCRDLPCKLLDIRLSDSLSDTKEATQTRIPG